MDNHSTDSRATAAGTGTPIARVAAAFAVVLLAPALAWVVWIAPVGESASDARHVLWFVTAALGCLVAGALVRFRGWIFGGLWAVAVVSAVEILYLWWSSVDITGLFMVGMLMAAPLILMAAPLLLLVGGAIGLAMRRSVGDAG